jgi:Tfp pilus assembly protein PilF/peroxiredoxin
VSARSARAALALVVAAASAFASGGLLAAGRLEPPRSPGGPFVYRPSLAVSESLKAYQDEIDPGSDLFPDERVAGELIERLRAFGARLREDGPRDQAVGFLLAPSFRGGRIRPAEETVGSRSPSLEIGRARGTSAGAPLDARAFGRELARLLEEHRSITVAELLLTALEVDRDAGRARSEVRYDLVGPGRAAHRVQLTGTWRLAWVRGAKGWSVAEWTAVEHTSVRARERVFAEVTSSAFGGIDSFRRQLAVGFDAWAAALDSGLAKDSNGHHGLSAGDVDGDGLDDLYAAQPYGFPDRLYRARGDGTFEDWTERSGLGTLEDTQHALFADVDNDGDQDLVLTTGAGPVLHVNDGSGRFEREPGAFRFERGLAGAPMSMAMADYDRDGFLDLYLCVYSFYYGAGEAKAGTPSPYHDAVNGPPNVLFRNDGGRGFVDVTREAGLHEGNDRFSFAAAWADYDEDGWPDLVVTNDFGRKNLYRNRGRQDGRVTFEDVAARAGVEDHAAGMSVLWLDHDGDGRLDIYGGQMWSDAGVRVTASRDFMPKAPEPVRALYRHHARGNTLLRNRGDGTFEDVTLAARANMGRWTWSSGALDFDADGWEDLYAVNGMVTRERSREDLDWMFWGGVVARSPLTQATGTPYDAAWRALNRMMVEHSVAGHQRNVFLRNDGKGGFDDVSGAVGLDLDEDGRAFAVLDLDQDGDPDVVSLAPRGAPQLRAFRNDAAGRGATLAVRLVGRAPQGNRDAVGARVTVETDRLRRTKAVHAGSGFLSQHSKELLFGLGGSTRVASLTVEWPSGRRDVFRDVPLERRVRIEEGGVIEAEPYAPIAPRPVDEAAPEAGTPPARTWLFEPFPVPDLALRDLQGEERSLSRLRGRPAVMLAWAAGAPFSSEALAALGRGADALARGGVGVLAIAFDPPADLANVRAAATGAAVPVCVATDEVALSLAILHRHLFMGRPDLPLPTTLLLDAKGQVVRVYRDGVDVPAILEDAERIEVPPDQRLARALPFAGILGTAPGRRDTVPYGRDLLDQGLEAPAAFAFEHAVQGRPTASVLYRLGSLLGKAGETAKARAAYEQALVLQPDLPEASNDLGALLAEGGDLEGAIARFRAALAAAPDYPDALNNLGYALLLTGRPEEARGLYEKALAIQPDFPEARNNLGLILGREGNLDGAEAEFRRALAAREGYAEAANNLALVLANRGRADEAVAMLQRFLEANPTSDSPYLTLAKVYLATGRTRDGLATLERLLERRPGHPAALELKRQFE